MRSWTQQHQQAFWSSKQSQSCKTPQQARAPLLPLLPTERRQQQQARGLAAPLAWVVLLLVVALGVLVCLRSNLLWQQPSKSFSTLQMHRRWLQGALAFGFCCVRGD